MSHPIVSHGYVVEKSQPGIIPDPDTDPAVFGNLIDAVLYAEGVCDLIADIDFGGNPGVWRCWTPDFMEFRVILPGEGEWVVRLIEYAEVVA